MGLGKLKLFISVKKFSRAHFIATNSKYKDKDAYRNRLLIEEYLEVNGINYQKYNKTTGGNIYGFLLLKDNITKISLFEAMLDKKSSLSNVFESLIKSQYLNISEISRIEDSNSIHVLIKNNYQTIIKKIKSKELRLGEIIETKNIHFYFKQKNLVMWDNLIRLEKKYLYISRILNKKTTNLRDVPFTLLFSNINSINYIADNLDHLNFILNLPAYRLTEKDYGSDNSSFKTPLLALANSEPGIKVLNNIISNSLVKAFANKDLVEFLIDNFDKFNCLNEISIDDLLISKNYYNNTNVTPLFILTSSLPGNKLLEKILQNRKILNSLVDSIIKSKPEQDILLQQFDKIEHINNTNNAIKVNILYNLLYNSGKNILRSMVEVNSTILKSLKLNEIFRLVKDNLIDTNRSIAYGMVYKPDILLEALKLNPRLISGFDNAFLLTKIYVPKSFLYISLGNRNSFRESIYNKINSVKDQHIKTTVFDYLSRTIQGKEILDFLLSKHFDENFNKSIQNINKYKENLYDINSGFKISSLSDRKTLNTIFISKNDKYKQIKIKKKSKHKKKIEVFEDSKITKEKKPLCNESLISLNNDITNSNHTKNNKAIVKKIPAILRRKKY